MHGEDCDDEGRVITAEYPKFYLVNAYAPMSQKDFIRREYRRKWDEAFYEYIVDIAYEKPIIMCGDFNVPRLDIDIYPENARMNIERSGYTSDEASNIETLLERGFSDAFRVLYPDLAGAYTWWSNRLNKRYENKGWRLDYFFIANELLPKVADVKHY